MGSFTIHNRNPGHWDVWDDRAGRRVFAIRGEPGNVIVWDERKNHTVHSPGSPSVEHRFRTVTVAMSWILDEMMVEPTT